MAEIMTALTAVSTGILDVVTDTATAIVATPLLLVPVVIGFFGAGVGLVMKFKRN